MLTFLKQRYMAADQPQNMASTDNKEREGVSCVEHADQVIENTVALPSTRIIGLDSISAQADRLCLRKLDLWLLPTILVTYAFQYMDKVILNSASQFGIVEDLHLYESKGINPTTHQPIRDLHRFSLATLIFYWGYLAAGRLKSS